MNICRNFIEVNQRPVTGSRILQQMNKLLPRGVHESRMTHSLLARYSSSSCSYSSSSAAAAFALERFTLLHQSPFSTRSGSKHFYYYSYFKDHKLSESTMESDPKVGQEAIKEQLREGYSKASNGYIDDILPHLLNLYGSRATSQDFEIYASHATFEDPLMRADGIKQIKSAFYSLAKLFSESRIVEYIVKEHAISPGKEEVLIDNKQYYKCLGKDIHMISLIKLNIENGKIVRHEDWWNKKPLWNRETVKLPLVGRITEMTRRASMMATHALMGFGKDPTI